MTESKSRPIKNPPLDSSRHPKSSIALTASVDDASATYGLMKLRHPSGTIWINGSAGQAGSLARVIIKATDVVLSLVPPQEISARSVLWGRVANIQFEGPIATVEIELKDDGPLLATITRGALEDLSLKKGSHVYALFKTAALDERSIGVVNA